MSYPLDARFVFALTPCTRLDSVEIFTDLNGLQRAFFAPLDTSMNRAINRMLDQSEGQYLTSEMRGHLLSCAQQLPARLDAMAKLEALEPQLVASCIERFSSRYAETTAAFIEREEKLVLDLQLVLRYCALAMVRDDRDFLREGLLQWLNPLLLTVMSQEALVFLFHELHRQLEAQAPAEVFALLSPFVKFTLNELDASSALR